VYNRCYVTPLLSGYLADEKWGRFKAIVVSVVIVLIGHVVLVISSLPPVIKDPKGALAALSIALIIIGLGTGGFKANISPLVAEQQLHPRPFISQTKSGERVVVNPALTTSRIFMVGLMFSLIRVVSMTDFSPSISTSSSTLGEWSARSP
jgi:POT family proton-dependent oligopeptide transporter